MSYVARRCSLFFVCRSSLVVSCRLSFVVLCSVVLCSLRMPYPSLLCCLTCWLLPVTLGGPLVHVTILFFFSLFLLLALPLSHASVCPSKTPPCVHSTAHVSTCARGASTHGDVLNVHKEAFQIYTRGFFNVSHHNAPTSQHNDTTHKTQHNTTARPHSTTEDTAHSTQRSTTTPTHYTHKSDASWQII